MIKAWTYAKAGEVVTCTRGHEIATIAKDIAVGGVYKPDLFKDWQQPEPAVGTDARKIRCQICGSPWFISGMILHIGDGWRDPAGALARLVDGRTA